MKNLKIGLMSNVGLNTGEIALHGMLSIMTEDRDKWRKYVHGVANPRIEDGYNKQNQRCSLETLVLVSSRLKDMKNGLGLERKSLGLGLDEKVSTFSRP